MGRMNTLRSHWSPVTKIVVSLLLLALFVYLLFRFSIILTPLVLAMILAYVLTPIVNAVQVRLGLQRGLSTVLIYLLVLLVIVALPLAVLPPLADQLVEMNLDLQRVLGQLEILLVHPVTIAGQAVDVEAVTRSAIGSLQGLAEPFIGQTFGLVVDVISSLVWVIFIVVVSIYLVKDGPKLRLWLQDMVPPVYREDYIRLRDEIGNIWSAFFRGQLVLALVVAIIFTAAGLILGLPFALAMALLAGLLEFLPSIGHGIWLAAASALALFVGSTWMPIPNWAFMLIVIGLHMVYQQFDLNYLIPRVIGRSVHLPPLVVILGIVTGAVLAGVLGILLAAPTIASARVIGRYVYANLFDLDPFPVAAAPSLPPPNPNWWRKYALRHRSGLR